MISIRPISLADNSSLASLHLKNLRSPLSGKSGLQLLGFNYRVLALEIGGCGFIAEKSGEPIGFVCGIWNPGLIHLTLLKKYFFPLAFWAAIQVTCRPALLTSFTGRFSHSSATSQSPGFELRPIVVSPAARGSGLAADLVNHLMIAGRKRGFYEIFLVTEVDNLPANCFYQRFGFKLSGSELRHGVIYNRYLLNI